MPGTNDDPLTVGKVGTVYVHLYSPMKCSFDDWSFIAYILLALFGIMGTAIIIRARRGDKEFAIELAKVGDANGDGVVDAEDLRYHDEQIERKYMELSGKKDQLKKMDEEKQYASMNLKKCPFCGAFISPDDTKCDQCGSKL